METINHKVDDQSKNFKKLDFDEEFESRVEYHRYSLDNVDQDFLFQEFREHIVNLDCEFHE